MIAGVNEAVKKLALARAEIERLTRERDKLRALVQRIRTFNARIEGIAERMTLKATGTEGKAKDDDDDGFPGEW